MVKLIKTVITTDDVPIQVMEPTGDWPAYMKWSAILTVRFNDNDSLVVTHDDYSEEACQDWAEKLQDLLLPGMVEICLF